MIEVTDFEIVSRECGQVGVFIPPQMDAVLASRGKTPGHDEAFNSPCYYHADDQSKTITVENLRVMSGNGALVDHIKLRSVDPEAISLCSNASEILFFEVGDDCFVRSTQTSTNSIRN